MGFSKLKIPKVCEQCHKPFEAKTITTRFCSNSCASKNGKERKKQEKELQEKEKILEKIRRLKLLFFNIENLSL